MVGHTVQAGNFQEDICKYNSVFAFASLTANIRALSGKGLACFRICGQIFNKVATFHLTRGAAPAFNHFNF